MTTRPLERIAQFPRPTSLGEFTMTAYRREEVFSFALSRGALGVDEVVVRIQSPCLFGEAFGVNSCDCGEQLREALRLGATLPAFLLIYPTDQEGRGLGLFQKLKAVEIEANEGVDMLEAFARLGFPLDLREYGTAAEIIRDLQGDRPIQLMTNNPKKLAGLTEAGIQIAGRVPLLVEPPNEACRRYLATKKRGMGHILPNIE